MYNRTLHGTYVYVVVDYELHTMQHIHILNLQNIIVKERMCFIYTIFV